MPGHDAAQARLSLLLRHLTSVQAGPPALPVIVVGGAVLDIQARPDGPADLQRGTSVPGKVHQVPGGVGRNIAEALSLLLVDPLPPPMLASVLGTDAAGTLLLSTLQQLRLDLSLVARREDMSTPCVLAALDKSGEVAACVADVASLELHLTPALVSQLLLQRPSPPSPASQPSTASHPGAAGPRPAPEEHQNPLPSTSAPSRLPLASIQRRAVGSWGHAGASSQGPLHASPSPELTHTLLRRGPIHGASTLVVEANLSVGAIVAACEAAAAAGVPIFLEPVSVPKASRCIPVLRHLTYISPNADELAAIAHALQAEQQQWGRQRQQQQQQRPPVFPGLWPQEGAPAPHQHALDGSHAPALTEVGDVCPQGSAGARLPRALEEQVAHAALLLAAGVRFVVLTLGAQGAALLSVEPEPPGSSGGPPGHRVQSVVATRDRLRSQPQLHQQPLQQPQQQSQQQSLQQSRQQQQLQQPQQQSKQDPSSHHTAPQADGHGACAILPMSGTCVRVRVAHMAALPTDVVSLSGAGDTLVAGMVASLVHGKPPVDALAWGMAAARLAVQSDRNVPPSLAFDEHLADGAARALATLQQRSFTVALP